MAYTSLVEALSEQKRRAKLQGRPPSGQEVRGVAEGYFGAQAGKQLQQRELAQRETLQTESLEAQKELQAKSLAQQKELEANRLAETKATREAQMQAAKDAEPTAVERGAKGLVAGGLGAWGGATLGAELGSGGGLPGAIIGGIVGFLAGAFGGCIIISACTDPNSYEVKLAREYRDRVLDKTTLGGYYRLCEIVVPWIHKSKTFKRFIKKCLVDRMTDYFERALGYKDKRELKTSWIVTESFLTMCFLIGDHVDADAWIELHR